MVYVCDCKISKCTRGQDEGGNENKNDDENQNICTLEEVHRLANVSVFSVIDSPTVVDCLLFVPQLDMTMLEISGEKALTVSQCSRLGHLVQISTNLKDLQLMIGMEDPEQLEIGLVAARHLTSFNLSGMSWGASKSRLHKRSLADFFVGTYCNQAVRCLLQDPHSQLRHLHLSKCKLHDDHFIPILDLLSASRLQTLDVSCNYITHRGVMEFARRLRNIKFLTSISLECNM